MTQKLTLDDLAAVDRDWLTCAQVAPILGANADSIRGQARVCPERLGFPSICFGNQVRIPKVPFLRFMGYQV